MATVTEQHIKDAVMEIARLADAGDNEGAHSNETALMVEVLRAIAAGAPNARELAGEAIKACEIDYARWCA